MAAIPQLTFPPIHFLRSAPTSGSLLHEWWWMISAAMGMFVFLFLIDKMFFKSNLGFDVIVSDDRIIAGIIPYLSIRNEFFHTSSPV
jgi:hypothetical protein